MRLSVIIPIYNTGKHIEDCVSSLFDQHIPPGDFEIILVNDGSTDNSLLICHQLAKRHRNIKVFNQKNQGQSVARNVGLKQAKGRFIYFIDSDDYLNSGYLNDFLNIIEKEQLDFLGFKFYHTSQRYSPSSQTESPEIEIEGEGLHIIDMHNYYNGSCWFIFEKAIAENLFFEEGRVCEDVIFTTKLLLKVKKGRIYKNRIYGYFTNKESTVRTKDITRAHKINDDMFYVAEKFSDIIENVNLSRHPAGFDRLRRRQESYTYFAIIRFIRNRRKHSELVRILSILENCKYPAYPINHFTRKPLRDKLLIKCLNNKVFLFLATQLNYLTGIIKS
ncbi:glycosyl transferase [Capnocytophaga cynodegmi]|uniref:glycosyltransferase family 2 protein n=1 Tax=Capnocytophaga cynodegmi TaxID=28189 RepID=UPI001AC90E64|nr:glycosyltransferase [Capnocytophaga cynodegmi]GIM51489.1 glycosyl transferase [Capnocytophaga cynodegmi]